MQTFSTLMYIAFVLILSLLMMWKPWGQIKMSQGWATSATEHWKCHCIQQRIENRKNIRLAKIFFTTVEKLYMLTFKMKPFAATEVGKRFNSKNPFWFKNMRLSFVYFKKRKIVQFYTIFAFYQQSVLNCCSYQEKKHDVSWCKYIQHCSSVEKNINFISNCDTNVAL